MTTLRPVMLAALGASLMTLAHAGCHGPVTLDQACADRAVHICAQLSDCRPNQLVSMFGDLTTCQHRVVLDCKTNAGISGVQAADVEACADEISGVDCDRFTFGSPTGPACERLLKSPLSMAFDCSIGLQCREGVCDTSVPSPAGPGCGRCSGSAPEGVSCGPPQLPTNHVACEVGFYCSKATGSCTQPGQEGDPCENELRGTCGVGFWCHQEVCTRMLSEGDACQHATADLCDQYRGLTCDLGSGRCIEAPKALRGVGESCHPSAPDEPTCGPRAFCRASTCTAILDDGQDCSPFSGVNPCLFPAVCADGQCGLIDPSACPSK